MGSGRTGIRLTDDPTRPDQQAGRGPPARARRTGTVMKAACGAVLGSGTTLIQ
jgi:hypothetical protein